MSASGNSDEDVTKGGEGESAPSVDEVVRRLIPDKAATGRDHDTLGYGRYADVFAAMIAHPHTDLPLSIAINAPWGAGKTSLANLIAERLTADRVDEGDQPYIVCHFNAWQHDDAGNLGGAFTAAVAKAADRERHWWKRLCNPIPGKYRSAASKNASKLLWTLGGIGVAIYLVALARQNPTLQNVLFGFFDLKAIKEGEQAIGAVGAFLLAAKGVYEKVVAAGQKSLFSFIANPEEAANDASVSAARNILTRLIREASDHTPLPMTRRSPIVRFLARLVQNKSPLAGMIPSALRERLGKISLEPGARRRFVIVVDDIERAEPPRAISILEVINQLLSEAPVVTILLGDMRVLAASAGMKYAPLCDVFQRESLGFTRRDLELAFGNRYLQKIVQVQFDLPAYLSHNDLDVQLLRYSGQTEKRLSMAEARKVKSQIDVLSVKPPQGVVPKVDQLRKGIRRTRYAINILRWIRNCIVLFSLPFFALAIYERFDGTDPASRMIDLTWIGVAIFFIVVFSWVLRGTRRKMGQGENELWTLIVEGISTSEGGTSDVNRFLLMLRDRQIERDEVRQNLTNDRLIHVARQRALGKLRWAPRSIKRLENALRLYSVIAIQNGLLNNPLTPEMLGKWLGFRERWPRLAQEVLCHLHVMEDLEAGAIHNEEAFHTLVQKLSPEICEDRDLRDYLAAEPPLGRVIETIVQLPIKPPESKFEHNGGMAARRAMPISAAGDTDNDLANSVTLN